MAMTQHDQTRAFLAHLHRGGLYAYWWTSEGRQSAWWEVGHPAPLFTGRRNVYFGIHPTDAIPETNRRGEPREPARVRSQIAHIAAVNCLFAEFDAKDYGDLAATLTHIDTLDPAPSVVIASGGGYHCYWLLREPWLLPDEAARQRAAQVQAAWVARVGGDAGAKDLARVLRVPGTRNYKYDPARRVEYERCDLDRAYALADLLALLPDEPHDSETPRAIAGPTPTDRTTEWAQRKLSDAIRMVATAPGGQRHTVLLKAARLAGGCAPHLSADEIVRALTAAAPGGWEDDREVERVILDGIAYGERAPLAPPRTPDALVWNNGAAYCPNCGEAVRPSKFYDDGLYCTCERPALTWRGRETEPPAGISVDRTWREDGDAPDDERPTYIVGPTAPHGITTLTTVPPPPVIWYAPGFLREGLGLLVGQPNVGKTPLAAQLALAAAAGARWLDGVQVAPCKVLYLGCEYSRQELYPLLTESIGAMRLKVGREITDDNFAYKTQDDPLPDSPDAAIADLEFYISLGYRLIVIDTLTAFLPPEKFKQNVYRGDYKELQPYHRLALKHSVAILGVWHASKRESDPKLMYNGSTGMWAVPSSRISMYEDQDGRKRISSFPRLGDRTDWALTQEKTIMGRRWVVSDAAPEPPQLSATEQAIYRWLRLNSNKDNPRTVATIAEMSGVNPNTVKSALGRMFDENIIQRGARGAYFVGSSGSSASVGSSGSSASSVNDVLTEDADASLLDLSSPRQDAPKAEDPKDPTFSGSQKIQQDPSPSLDAIPDEQRLRTAGYRWLGVSAGWYGYTPGQTSVGPLESREAVLAWLWTHYQGEAR
jgi:DNA-binding CsgD family transcriptional regulator